jgi:hypothetical protein
MGNPGSPTTLSSFYDDPGAARIADFAPRAQPAGSRTRISAAWAIALRPGSGDTRIGAPN